eukprot:TRINITY_DN21628_c0_g1_i11.p1 TRINITY_DN21628_c0_g1~~TRINITY_DN21628_c0_g1_i11.p1  ORF type:complete len:508 (-),score=183.12 TRINITY_DN21628_c0_g1_i11:125-1648(-)
MSFGGNGNFNAGPGQSGGGWPMPPSPGAPDANMMMQQIQQLQKTVMQLQTSSGQGSGPGAGASNTFRGNAFGSGPNNGPGDGFGGGPGTNNGGAMGGGYSNYVGNTPGTQGHSNYTPWSNRGRSDSKEGEEDALIKEEQKVLLVSNIPPNLSNPDSLFYAFEKFGTVDRVKILHNKRNTALIQMSQPEEAHKAYNEQDKLNRVGTEIYVNFSSKFKEIKVQEPGSMYDDGLTKDYTGQFPTQQQAPRQNNFTMGQNYDNMGGNMGGGMGMFGGMNSMGGGGGNFNMDPQNYGFNNYGEIARGNQAGGLVLLVSNIPDQIAKVENIFNMIGMYGDVIAVKILRNKRDCCMVQMAKPHHAQQVRNYLDQAKVGGNKLCISNSRVESLLNKRIAEDNELQMDFSNSRNHRYRNHAMAAKLTKNLGPPSSTLHVANLPEELNHNDIKDMFIEKGFTVKESKECGASGTMALLTMASPDEALLALAVMHNYAPEQYKFKNTAGLCVSFSAKK